MEDAKLSIVLPTQEYCPHHRLKNFLVSLFCHSTVLVSYSLLCRTYVFFFNLHLRCFFVVFFVFFLATSHSIKNLSSLTRDGTHSPLHWKLGVLTTRPPGKSQGLFLFFVFFN